MAKQNPIAQMGLYALSLIAMKGSALIALPFVARYLSPSALGQLELIGSVTMFLSLVVGLAMHENLYRFIAVEEAHNTRKRLASKLYSVTILISLLLSALAGVTLFVLSPSDLSAQHIALIALAVSYEAPLAICLAWLRLNDQASLFVKLTLATVALQLGGLFTLLQFTTSITAIVAWNVTCTLGQFLFLHLSLRFRLSLPSRATLLRYLRYSMPIMLSAMVAFGMSGAERWFIAAGNNLDQLGLYAVAAKFALAVGILIQPFHMMWMPKRFAHLEKGQQGYVVRMTQLGVLCLTLIAVSVGVFAQLFINVAMPASYQDAALLLPFAIIIMVLKELTELTNIGLLAAKQSRLLLLSNVIATTAALWLCASFYEMGAGAILICLGFGQAVRFVLVLTLSQRHHPLPFHLAWLIQVITLSVVTVLTPLWLEDQGLYMAISALSLVGLIALSLFAKLFSLEDLLAQKVLISKLSTMLKRSPAH